ncbi:xylose isomerase [Opitutaceae bacterium TAV5]|nr:xylose isomerase [Opitutaceae bacterium TAV5]
MKSNKYSVILGNLGNTCDRFLPTGYKSQPTKAEMIRQAASIEGLGGLELVGGWDVTPENAREMHSLMSDHGLACVSIIPDFFSRSVWGSGSFCSRDANVRKLALEEGHRAAEVASLMGCPLLNLWLGQDGYDYPLQSDFGSQRQWMLEGIRSLAGAWPALKFALEYKVKEPRVRSFHARAADTLLMARETDLPNVGVCIDVGHAFAAEENVAESAWLLNHYGNKLFHMHYNDNYGHWDDDMIVGSVHLVHYIELYYWLRKIGYEGWHSMDQYPYREDGVRAVSESIAFLQSLERSLTTERLAEIGALLAKGDATKSTRWMREFVFGRHEPAFAGEQAFAEAACAVR